MRFQKIREHKVYEPFIWVFLFVSALIMAHNITHLAPEKGDTFGPLAKGVANIFNAIRDNSPISNLEK